MRLSVFTFNMLNARAYSVYNVCATCGVSESCRLPPVKVCVFQILELQWNCVEEKGPHA